jgi:hypothetical protein
MKSHAICTGTRVTLTTGEEFLVVEIAIDCPACGKGVILIAGHHLRTVRDAMIEMIDLHPDLSGEDADVQVLQRLRHGGPGEPTSN